MPMLASHVELIDAVSRTIVACGGADAVLTGSLANGTADIYSDIDLEVICDSVDAKLLLKDATNRCLRQNGRTIASFAATHLQMPDLLINFLERDDVLVKIDVNFVMRTPDSARTAGIWIVGASPENAVGGAVRTPSPHVDFSWLTDLHNKFCGWMWYTHTKIARGEYWEAQDSLAVMRAQAVVPLLQVADQLVS